MKKVINEKIKMYGTKTLTNLELLSAYLSVNGENGDKVANEIMISNGFSISDIVSKPGKIYQTCHMNEKIDTNFQVFGELHRRISQEINLTRYKITSPSSIANIFMEEMRYLQKEHIKVVFLDTKNGIISDSDISIGTINTALVDPREIFIEAVQNRAVNIILLHNHPSGDPTPSIDDIDVTKRCVEAGKMIGIELLDHIIIGDGNFESFKEKGLGGLH